MTKRIRYEEIDGEPVKIEVDVYSCCSCLSASGYDLVKTECHQDEDAVDVCNHCGSYVVWTNQEEISNNARR